MPNYRIINGELYHWGVKGQKWGKRRYQNKDGTLTPAGKKRYSSTGIRSAMARRSNEKVDASFDKWREGAANRDNAIELGKKANAARIAYESNKSDKSLKTAYKDANKEYKKALGTNTAYRKGTVRQEVGRDASRKYLSEARKVKKLMDKDPSNRDLQKQYNDLMSKHDVERAKARRAQAVGQRRSNQVASIKRSMTVAAKTAAGTAAVAAGMYAVNKYLESRDVRVNGAPVRIGQATISGIANTARTVKNLLGFLY